VSRKSPLYDFLKYRGDNPGFKPTPEQESVISQIANSRVAGASGSPYREPEGWGEWAGRVARETPGKIYDDIGLLLKNDLTPEGQVKDFAKTLPGMGANMVEGTLGTPGDLADTKWEIVNWLNDQFKGSSGMDMGLDLARAKKMSGAGSLPTSQDIRENVTRPLVGSSVDYEPQGPAGKLGALASNFVGPEDLVPAAALGKAGKVIKLLRGR
jgi:hypothetical protein